MALLVIAHQRRSSQESITLTFPIGQSLGASDKVRLKVGRPGKAPQMDIVGGTPLSGGTTLTNTNPAILSIDQDDVSAESFVPGNYDLEVSVVDATDGDRIKHAETGVFVLMPTQLGSLS